MSSASVVRQVLRGCLYTFLVVAIAAFIVWPSSNAYMIHRELVHSLQHAQTVRLEEFSGTNILTALELSHEQWPQVASVASSAPIVPDLEIPLVETLCFIPHHRIVMRDEQGKDSIFSVCFECEKVKTEEFGEMEMPYLWRASLRRLFTNHKIPVREMAEYFRLAKEQQAAESIRSKSPSPAESP
jgi:hypothetical protein